MIDDFDDDEEVPDEDVRDADPAELEISTATVCEIIALARAFDVKVPVEELDAASNATDDMMNVMLEDQPDDATEDQLRDRIEALDIDEKTTLVALAWLGRGTYSLEEWDEALSEARRSHGRDTADYLLGLPLLGDYLEEGLAAFDLDCSDFAKAHL
jgi:hypothetical protein